MSSAAHPTSTTRRIGRPTRLRTGAGSMSPTRVGASWPADAASVDMRPCLAQRGGPRTHVACDGSRPERPDGLRWRAVLPAITYPAELPVSGQREEIARAIRDHQVVIVAGATGSGKTTQLPKICLELGRESIAHTQPRRIAARTIAERIAEELGVELGGLVGYQVRFTDRVERVHPHQGDDRRHPAQRDPPRPRAAPVRHDHHRRGARAQPQRRLPARLPQAPAPPPPRPQGHRHERDDRPRELRAALRDGAADGDARARHRGLGPHLPRRGALPPARGRGGRGRRGRGQRRRGRSGRGQGRAAGILDALDELERESSGDVLVFLSGESEIRDAEAAVRAHATRRGGAGETEVLPLYGRLSSADQHRVFEPSKVAGLRRRVVLATNVAETSLTVPGIRYVVDAGTARISRYSRAVEGAAAADRGDLAGVGEPALRSLRPHERRHRHPPLLGGGLRAAARVHRPRDPAHEPRGRHPADGLARARRRSRSSRSSRRPTRRGIRDGLDLLRELGAIDDGAAGDGPQLTRIGRQLAAAADRAALRAHGARVEGAGRRRARCSRSSPGSPSRTRASDRSRGASRPTSSTPGSPTRRATSSRCSTSGTTSRSSSGELSGSAFRRMCKAEFLNYLRVREWQDLYRQLVRLAQAARPARGRASRRAERRRHPPGAPRRPALADRAARRREDLERSRRSGLRPRDGAPGRRQQAEFVGARNTRFVIFPGSALAKKPPAALMSAELVETSRLFARTNAAIDPAWAEQLAGDRSPSAAIQRAALGDAGRASAVADEKVTLFGVPIVREAAHPARAGRPGARARALHPARARRGGLGHEPPRPPAVRRSCARTAPCAASSARSRSARAVATSSPATRPSSRSTSARVPADVADTRALRALVARRAPPTPRPAHDDAAPTCSATRRTTVDGDGFPDRWRQDDQTLLARATGSSRAPTTTA